MIPSLDSYSYTVGDLAFSPIPHPVESFTYRGRANQPADLLVAWSAIDGEERILVDMVWDELDRALKSDTEVTMYKRTR
ncbi:hypothetical protein QJS04_geneDACA016052 [Acorus gramineus]|uniref:Uncharacterized protein n=1 Tax=Acorus gramineus TaxID=55184 RepID=A0AAV9BH96_ACOGR|nr:hypothetical protein QJS04_geneDACA016052 [Acorus gramineus]